MRVRRIGAGVAAALAAIGVAACGGSGGGGDPTPAAGDPAGKVPANAVLYASATVRPGTDQVKALEHVVNTFGGSGTWNRFLTQLDRAHLLICDELGYVTMSRGGVELLFRVFADRYERGSILVTSNLPFSEWDQIFQGERMTAALLDRLTHHAEIFEMNGESYRFRESMKSKKGRKSA